MRGITSFLQAEPSSKDFVYPLLEAFEQVSDTIPAPRIIGPLPVIDLSPTTATITWTTDRGGNSLVAYASVSDYSSSRQEPYTQVVGNPDEHITSHTVKVLGLMPATLYHYQLRTNPHFGAIAESKDFTFTTPAQTPEISSASPKIIGQNSASFTWTTNLLTDSVVRYTPVVDGKPQTSQAKVQGSTELTTTHNVTVVDLKPGAKYEVEIISRDAYGNQIAQKLPSINTGEDKEPPVISQIRTSSAVVPGKTIAIQTIISWKTDEPATSQVTWQEGVVENKDLERTTPLLNSLTTDHLVVITQFQPATVYRFFVKSADSAGNEALSRTFTILTPRQEQTVLQIIVKNFQDIFPFTK